MKVLVTGGAGYIGSHTCKALALAGHEPVVYDNLSEGYRWAVKWGPLVEGDIADQKRLESVMRDHRIEAVVHFAANAYVGESMQNPMKYFSNNVAGTVRLLDAMLNCGVGTIVFSSTCTVYGEPEAVPIDESTPLKPVNPYGESKLMIEKKLGWLGKLKGLRWIALRYFNAAGADPDGEIGEAHDPETHLIPLVLRAATPGEFTLQVFGTDYATPDGTAVRDYIHVQDLAAAHVLALRALQGAAVNDVFNLGTGKGASVSEIIDTVEKVTGAKVRYQTGARRAGDPQALVANPAKANEKLGWRASRSTLDVIISDAWAWHCRQQTQPAG
ncbi:MAG: UDP-glucose 4-epimerase GalE [Steroidobacteraceae bacterium]